MAVDRVLGACPQSNRVLSLSAYLVDIDQRAITDHEISNVW